MNRLGSSSLAGKLLVAHPALRDINFSRTVVYMVAHSAEEGAMGFVLNRPLDKSVSELISDVEFSPMSEVAVRWGGPVAGNQLSFALLHPVSEVEGSNGFTIKPGIALENLEEFSNVSGLSICAFLGYSGWGAGQVEKEIERRSWIVQVPARELFAKGLDAMWQSAMRGLGPLYRLEAEAPENPWLN